MTADELLAVRRVRPAPPRRRRPTRPRATSRATIAPCPPTLTERNRAARELFAPLAPTYDRYARLLSFGQDPRWRAFLVSRIEAGPATRSSTSPPARPRSPSSSRAATAAASSGVDQSAEMLAAGRLRVAAAGLDDRIELGRGASRGASLRGGELRRPHVHVSAPLRGRSRRRRCASSPASSGRAGRSPCSSSSIPRARAVRTAWEVYVRAGLPVAGQARSRPGGARWAIPRTEHPRLLRALAARAAARGLARGGNRRRAGADAESRRRSRRLGDAWRLRPARPAFYALASGGWRDYVTLLHPPYTAWHLSYVADRRRARARLRLGSLPPHARRVLPGARHRRARARRAERPPAPHAIPRGLLVALAAALDRRRGRHRRRRRAHGQPLDRRLSSPPAPSSSSPTTSSSPAAASTATSGSRSPGVPSRSSPPTSPSPSGSTRSRSPAPHSRSRSAAPSASSPRRCGTCVGASPR